MVDLMVEDYRGFEPELLILWGAQDAWHPVAFGTRLQSLVPGSRLEVILMQVTTSTRSRLTQ